MRNLFKGVKEKLKGIGFWGEYLEKNKILLVREDEWYSDFDRHFYVSYQFDSVEEAREYILEEIPKSKQDQCHLFKLINTP